MNKSRAPKLWSNPISAFAKIFNLNFPHFQSFTQKLNLKLQTPLLPFNREEKQFLIRNLTRKRRPSRPPFPPDAAPAEHHPKRKMKGHPLHGNRSSNQRKSRQRKSLHRAEIPRGQGKI